MSRPKVFITCDFHERALKLLRNHRFDVECYPFPSPVTETYLLEHVKGVNAIVCQSTDNINEEVLTAAGSQLKIVATMSKGFEHIDIDYCKNRNIQVTCLENVTYGNMVAHYTIGLLESVCMKLNEADSATLSEGTKSWHRESEVKRALVNSTVGIVEMGVIGQSILTTLVEVESAKFLFFDMYHRKSKAEFLGASYVPFEELLKESDYIIVNCHLTEKSRHLFGSKEFSLMKPNAVFINSSRGGVVDHGALIKALKNNQIRAAAIDIKYPGSEPLDNEIFSLDNLIAATSRLDTSFMFSPPINSEMTAKNVIEVLEGFRALTPVF